jgi:hypothetical protein
MLKSLPDRLLVKKLIRNRNLSLKLLHPKLIRKEFRRKRIKRTVNKTRHVNLEGMLAKIRLVTILTKF